MTRLRRTNSLLKSYNFLREVSHRFYLLVFFPEMKGGKLPGNFGRSQEVGNPAAARIERFEAPNSESAKESEIHALDASRSVRFGRKTP
jgi:hypothetical protein